MRKKVLLFFIFFLTVLCRQGKCDLDPDEEEKCRLNGGYCSSLEFCDSALENIKKRIRPTICGFEGKDPHVCCDPLPRTRSDVVESISLKRCKQYGMPACTFLFVYSGAPAEPKELPFMALIGYGPDDDITWQCGGSIVSPNYVLSAAHCSESNLGPAKWARLGELDLSSKSDHRVDVRITVRFSHPGYKPPASYNDIALFRLQTLLQFSDYIRPVCLQPVPEHEEDEEDFDHANKVMVAGWGRTDFVGPVSSRLMKAEVDILPDQRCRKHETDRNQLPRGYDTRSMICARLEKDGKGSDTCQGDSGGPIFKLPKKQCRLRTQLGVTSFGRDCGNPDYPGVYTNVSHYIDWIESIVWPGNVSDVKVVWKN